MKYISFVIRGDNMGKFINSPYADTIFFNIEQIAKYIQEDYLKKYNNEVTHDEFRAMGVISCNPDICQRDLAKLILRDCVKTGRILDSLEKKGFVERYQDAKGKRLVRKMKLTKSAEEFYSKTLEEVHKGTIEFFRMFSDKQLNELNNNLKLLLGKLKEMVEIEV